VIPTLRILWAVAIGPLSAAVGFKGVRNQKASASSRHCLATSNLSSTLENLEVGRQPFEEISMMDEDIYVMMLIFHGRHRGLTPSPIRLLRAWAQGCRLLHCSKSAAIRAPPDVLPTSSRRQPLTRTGH